MVMEFKVGDILARDYGRWKIIDKDGEILTVVCLVAGYGLTGVPWKIGGGGSLYSRRINVVGWKYKIKLNLDNGFEDEVFIFSEKEYDAERLSYFRCKKIELEGELRNINNGIDEILGFEESDYRELFG